MKHRRKGWMRRIATRLTARAVLLVLGVFLAVSSGAGAVSAQEETPSDPGADRLIADGRLVFEANCQACHQPGGAGVPGTFPPLLDNPNVQNEEYVRTVVRNGVQGEIEVLGTIYNGQMPAFGLLDDDQVTALIAYLQEGLGMPAPPPPAATGAGGTAGTSLPSAAVLTYVAAFLVALVGIGIVVAPMVLAPTRTETFTPVQTWLKTAAIVAYFVITTVVLPSMLLEAGFMASPPPVYGDLISADLWDVIRSLLGTGAWLVALGFGVWGLRRLQRNKVI